MKKNAFIVLFLISALTCGVQAFAAEAGTHQLLAEEILEKYAGSNFYTELAYLPQAYLLLEEALISAPDNYKAQELMAEYLIQASAIMGNHPKKAIRILENLPSCGDNEQDSITAHRLGRAYYLDGQREKALSALIKSLSIYGSNEAAKAASPLLSVSRPPLFRLYQPGREDQHAF